jgi:hypothetical protein
MGAGAGFDVEDALRRVADIHAQVARSTFFRGYRAEIAVGQAILALSTATVEWFSWAALDAQDHASIWLVVALVCALTSSVDIVLRRRFIPRPSARLAALQLSPALVVGVVLAPLLWGQAELLPGIWTMLFGVGLLSSAPYLPGHIRLLGLFYLAAGAVMTHAAGIGLSSPWSMGLTFGGGQLVAAAILRELQASEVVPHQQTSSHPTISND